jgi:hypothetical protein
MVFEDGQALECSVVSLGDVWLLDMNYTHSTHDLAVNFAGGAVPEFPSSIAVAVILLSVGVVAVLFRKKKAAV